MQAPQDHAESSEGAEEESDNMHGARTCRESRIGASLNQARKQTLVDFAVAWRKRFVEALEWPIVVKSDTGSSSQGVLSGGGRRPVCFRGRKPCRLPLPKSLGELAALERQLLRSRGILIERRISQSLVEASKVC